MTTAATTLHRKPIRSLGLTSQKTTRPITTLVAVRQRANMVWRSPIQNRVKLSGAAVVMTT